MGAGRLGTHAFILWWWWWSAVGRGVFGLAAVFGWGGPLLGGFDCYFLGFFLLVLAEF